MSIAQIAQRVVDLDRATEFYTTFLGKAPDARFVPPGLVFFNLDGVRLMLDDKVSSAIIYFFVDDIDATILQLRARGVTVTTEPHIIFQHADDRIGPAGHDEWMAFFTDSEGNTVGLVEHRANTP